MLADNKLSTSSHKKEQVNQDPVAVTEAKNEFPGYPLYPADQDIYSNAFEEENLDPEDLENNKTPNPKNGSLNKDDLYDDETGEELDVPGSELDDADEAIGNEDEENNYYSLGGDNHNDLEEDKGE